MKRAKRDGDAAACGRSLHPVVRQFVCILNNCESVVIWAYHKSAAENECREKYGVPVHTWATKRQFHTSPSSLEKARLFGDIQTSNAACDYKPNPAVRGRESASVPCTGVVGTPNRKGEP